MFLAHPGADTEVLAVFFIAGDFPAFEGRRVIDKMHGDAKPQLPRDPDCFSPPRLIFIGICGDKVMKSQSETRQRHIEVPDAVEEPP